MDRILGAGLSGLSCAINLAALGRDVTVYERNPSVGAQAHENYQVLQTRGRSVEDYLGSLSLEPDFHHFNLSKTVFSTTYRDIDLSLSEPVHFVQRGGENSLEWGLWKEAFGMGVKFEFSSKEREEDVDIVATGPKRVDAAAFGAVYDGVDFPRDKFLMMYDDKYSPRGWYLYVIPFREGMAEVVNCASQPHASRVKDLFYKALSERKILREYFNGKKPVSTFGGFGNAGIPDTAVHEGRILVGEAAGFQDPFRGFGMCFALESGKIAAEALASKSDYDAMWKKQFMPQFKLDYSRRFAISIFGSRLIDVIYSGTKPGDAIKFKSGNIGGPAGDALKTVFLNAEKIKRNVTGHW